MKLILSALSILTLLLGGKPLAAQDAPVCMNAFEMEAALIDWYGESPVEPGANGSMIWASRNGETWTEVSYREDGQSCVIAQGTGWVQQTAPSDLLASTLRDQG